MSAVYKNNPERMKIFNKLKEKYVHPIKRKNNVALLLEKPERKKQKKRWLRRDKRDW